MRDALSKALYGKLFDWLVNRINVAISKGAISGPAKHIGVLDIFGFEVFEHNSFEQLCINFANEKLQFQFNEFILREEMKMYREEGKLDVGPKAGPVVLCGGLLGCLMIIIILIIIIISDVTLRFHFIFSLGSHSFLPTIRSLARGPV